VIVIVTVSHYAEHSAHSASLNTQIAHFYGNEPALMTFKGRGTENRLVDLARIITNGALFEVTLTLRMQISKTHRCAADAFVMIDSPVELESISS
jgi:hypothetical protein